jgi:hypothetical protein
VGSFFFGTIENNNGDYLKMHIFCSRSTFESLVSSSQLNIGGTSYTNSSSYEEEERILPLNQEYNDLYVNSTNTYSWTNYKKRTINTTGYAPTDIQRPIIEDITDYYHKNLYCVA